MLTSDTNSQNGLTVLLIVSVSGTVAATLGLFWLLKAIEYESAAQFIHQYTSNADNLELEVNFEKENGGIANNLETSSSYASIETEKKNNNDDTSTGRIRLSGFRLCILAFLTAVLVLLSYLLLVVSSASQMLSMLGLSLVSVVMLHSQILEEVRRSRYDRLAAMVTLVLLLAMSLNLVAYANKQVAMEDMYQGPARIVGYDTSSYESLQAGKDTTSTKTDLEVAWGAAWACPNLPNQECRANLNGALCERDGSSDVDDDGSEQYTDKRSEESYYDSSGKKVDGSTENEKVYDKDGNLIQDYGESTTSESENGHTTSYQDNSKDTVYDSEGNVEEKATYDETSTYDKDTGDYKESTSSYQDSSYYKNGTMKEYSEMEEEVEPTDGGGKEDYYVDYDVTYKGNEQVDEIVYSVEDEETNADGQEEDVTYEDYDIKENNDGSYEAYGVDEEATYDGQGHVATEEFDEEEIVKQANGTMSEELDNETVDFDESGGYTYNTTEEDIVYDQDYNVVKDSTEVTGSGGNRLRRNLEDTETLQKELKQEQSENEELEKENEELEEEVEELEQELGEEEEEVEDAYAYTDDEWYESYWEETDWDSVWGDYNCYNMFDANLEGITYDSSIPPGEDDWPYLNIYGNCRTCEAYIVDYYSTEHFLSIRSYKEAGRNYGVAACFSLMLTLVLALKQRFAPKGDNQMDLLASANTGTFA